MSKESGEKEIERFFIILPPENALNHFMYISKIPKKEAQENRILGQSHKEGDLNAIWEAFSKRRRIFYIVLFVPMR